MSACTFCHGKPVINARSWIAAGEPHYVPCPQCGAEWDEDALSEYAHADEQAVRDELASHCARCDVLLNEHEVGLCAVCYRIETEAIS